MQNFVHIRNSNILDETDVYSSEIPKFLIAPRNTLEYQELLGAAESSRLVMPHHNQQHYELISDFGNRRNGTFPHQHTDWFLNNATNSLPYGENQYQNNSLQDIIKSMTFNRSDSDMVSIMHYNACQGICNVSECEFQPNHLSFGWKNQTDSNQQSLSLSLSSNVTKNKAYNVSQFDQDGISTSTDEFQCMKYVKPSVTSRDYGKSLQEMVVGMIPNSKTSTLGPLGPFTGYATILKSSRYLKIAQNLLEDFCCTKFVKTCDVSETEVVASKGSNYSCSSSSMFHSADLGARSNFGVSMRSDYEQNKAKLMYMQEEVSKRYKHYYQQMQMVFASFESVAGLDSATPYITLALKSVSKHFKSLNNAISNHLKLISEVLRNDSSIGATTDSSQLVDTNMASLRCMDQSLQKNKLEKVPTGFHDLHQQNLWRPQRGFPERAVAILRAWLFEHFLHPYPTDFDKQMLATQTGLSRNQVSNWFINARVRVWKPMVDEVHMLDKKTTDTSESSKPNESTFGTVGSSSQPRMDKASRKFTMHSNHEDEIQYMEFGSISIDTNSEENELNEVEQWRQEKRSKLECGMSSRMDGTLMDFLPYRHSGHDVGRSLGLDLFH